MPKAYQDFPARAFSSDPSGEPIEGRLYFTSHSLSFRGGKTAIDIPLNLLRVTHDQAGEERLILRSSSQPDWTIVTSDMDVLEFRSVPEIARIADQVESRLTRRELSRRGKLVVLFFAGGGLVLWLGMLAMGAMVRAVVAKVPPQMEQEFGKGLLDELKGELEFSDDTNEVARLAAVAQPLLDVLPRTQQWQFYVVKEPAPNAFALPGGHIVVTSGLLRLASRPEEVLGVVAHEVAHVTHKHGFRNTISAAGPFLVFQLFLSGGGGSMAAVAGGSALLVQQSFSQEYEKEADDVGWKYLVAANIDPRGMIDIFRKLKVAELADNQPRLLPKAFESHPDTDKRIARLEAKWKRLPRKSGYLQLSTEPESDR